MNKELLKKELAAKLFDPQRHEQIVRKAAEQASQDQQKMLETYQSALAMEHSTPKVQETEE